MTAPGGASASRAGSPGLGRWAALLAAGLVVGLVLIAALRLGSPFALEWEEGATVLSADRLSQGAPLYVAPSLDWAPFPYGPGQPALAAALRMLGLDGLPGARLTSWLGTLMLLLCGAALAGRRAGPTGATEGSSTNRIAGLLAAGWMASAYPWTGAWLDVARPDALALGLASLALLLIQRSGEGVGAPFAGRLPAALLGALLGALAVHTKQTVLLPLAGGVLGLALAARGTALVAGSLLGIGVVAGFAAGGPWYRFHTLELLAGHPLHLGGLRSFLSRDLLHLAPLLGAAALGLRRLEGGLRDGMLAGWALGGLCAAVMGRLHPGGFDNVVLPAVVGLAPLAARGVQARRGLGLLLLGVAVAVGGLGARGLVPPGTDRAAWARVTERLARIDGEILAPAHPELLRAVHKPTQLHLMFLLDLSASEAGLEHARSILQELEGRLEAGRYRAAVLPRFPDGADAPLHALVQRWLPRAEELARPGELIPVSGAPHAPAVLYLPGE
jgi:hypothetical protein